MIELIIKRKVKNDNFENELKEYKENSRFRCGNFDERSPERERTENIMNIEITEEQFNAIRRAIIDTF